MASILPDWMFPGKHVTVQFGSTKGGGQLCKAVVLEIDPHHNSARVQISSLCPHAEQLGLGGFIMDVESHRLHPLKETDRLVPHNRRGVAHHNHQISASSTASSRPHHNAKRSSFSFLRRPLSVFGQAYPSDSEFSESENEISQSRSRGGYHSGDENVPTRDRGGTTSSLASWNSVSSLFSLVNWGQGQPKMSRAPTGASSITRYRSDTASTNASEIRSRGKRYEIDDEDSKASEVPERRDSLFQAQIDKLARDFIPNMLRGISGWSATDSIAEEDEQMIREVTGERAVLPDVRMPVIDESSDDGFADYESEPSRQAGTVEEERAYEIGQEVYVLMGKDWCPGTIVENDDDNKFSLNYRVRLGTGNGTQVRYFWPSQVRVMNETQE